MPRPWLECLRVFLATAETMCFYAAVSVLPLADAITYYLAGPIYVTLIAALFLGEKVGWRRWTAVLVGFGGVLLALQPTRRHLRLACADRLRRQRHLRAVPDRHPHAPRHARHDHGGLADLDGAPLRHRRPPGGTGCRSRTASDVVLLCLLGVVALGAIVCVNRSLTFAPASVVVPYQYTLIVWAIVFGYVFFGDVPDLLTLIGAAIIVAAGLFIYFRERKVRGADVGGRGAGAVRRGSLPGRRPVRELVLGGTCDDGGRD